MWGKKKLLQGSQETVSDSWNFLKYLEDSKEERIGYKKSIKKAGQSRSMQLLNNSFKCLTSDHDINTIFKKRHKTPQKQQTRDSCGNPHHTSGWPSAVMHSKHAHSSAIMRDQPGKHLVWEGLLEQLNPPMLGSLEDLPFLEAHECSPTQHCKRSRPRAGFHLLRKINK